ncbi:TfoX/Sxy family protein [Chitinibacter bivalviorum]|uniref:TfoX/Sxy family protein n=1 Tax=Chitinibacter bivalviorum TaxID=2739434 RepID=A0A7H9BKH7_9NEIS|nr:TfoX/Sxy family protein [Chitinibacter bivalviorum]QLG88826.1 TfoX/Sxy family protein [Chitinibacter bivalviorum]
MPSEYLRFLLEQLQPLGHLRAKAMFGGHGLYCDEIFFAIVVDDVLYVKVDEHNRPRFLAAELAPFSYSMKDGRTMSMSYYPLPESALEERAELLDWAREGIAAALRAPERKTRKKTKA